MRRKLMLTMISVMVLIMSGCANAMPSQSMPGMDHSAMTTATPMVGMDHSGMMSDTQTLSGTEALSDTQMSGGDHSMMNMDSTQPFDAQFIDGMIEHHQGAITMAEQALEQAEHEELRTLAKAVITAQQAEIEQMTSWRQSWYPNLAPTGGMEMDMGDMEVSNDESKPFDQRFIEAMISHHQGAIDMATMAQQMAEHQEIKDLADSIITAQQAEIEQMQEWQQTWFGGN